MSWDRIDGYRFDMRLSKPRDENLRRVSFWVCNSAAEYPAADTE
jgi:hypothetical protein